MRLRLPGARIRIKTALESLVTSQVLAHPSSRATNPRAEVVGVNYSFRHARKDLRMSNDLPVGALPEAGLLELIGRAERLLAKITPGEWSAVDWPGQGWTVCWKPDAPICHMRWTDGLRPEVEARIEAEAKFIAAAPQLVRDLLDAALQRVRCAEDNDA